MTTVVTNYTIVGNPTISSDYVLTGTDASNYLNFNNYGVFDVTKSFDIIFKFRATSSDEYYGIFTIGDNSSTSTCITSYVSYGRVYIRIGNNSLTFSGLDITQDYYYKVSYDSSESKLYSYYSEDGDDWTLKQSRSVSSMPNISVANNLIGVYNTYYLISDETFLDLASFKIIIDGDVWFQAVKKNYDPVVTASEVLTTNLTFKGKKQINTLDCNNVQFVNNDMSFAFVNCVNLTQITNINQNTTNMAYAFAGCNTALYDTGFPQIPNSVNDITGLFAYHTDWTDIPVQAFVNAWSKVPAHLQNNVAGFLDGCTNLSNVPANTLPNFMTNIAYAFRNCKSMTDMPIITENIVDMSNAFYRCSNLVNANYEIPNSVVNMSNAFYECSKLISPPNMVNATNVVDMSDTFHYCRNMTTPPIIPNSVTNLSNAFSVCGQLTTPPIIPNSVTNLSYAFYLCSCMVTPPIIPNSVIDMIGTFQACNSMVTPPAIPNSVVNMSYAFSSSNKLTSGPTIPNSVINMAYAFTGCNNLTTPPNIIGATNLTDISYAFNWCSNLTYTPVFPNNIIKMWGTFTTCANLRTISPLPNNVINLSYAFHNCQNITTPPEIPNSATDLSHIFQQDYNLTRAPFIPNSVTNLVAAFSACNKLSSVSIISDSVINMTSTFFNAQSLTTAPVIPNHVIDMNSTFQNCTNLTGDIYIKSSQIINAYRCFYCYNGVFKTKNVYIPFTYVNGENTETYNSFIAEGYDTSGTTNGVYLKDISLVDDTKWNITEDDDAIYLNTYTGSDTRVVVPMGKA